MTTGCYETSLLLFANARGARTLLTVKCLSPGTHHETNARGLPGGGGCSRLELTRTLVFEFTYKLNKYIVHVAASHQLAVIDIQLTIHCTVSFTLNIVYSLSITATQVKYINKHSPAFSHCTSTGTHDQVPT